MRCRGLLPIVVLAWLSSGCLVLTLQPAYDDRSIVFEEKLIGRWENAEDRTSVTIDRAEWRSYKVTYVDRFATLAFHGNLTKVASSTFLDLTEIRGTDAGPYLVPVHGLYRVEVAGDTLTASAPDYAWFTRAMAQKTVGRLNVALDGRRNAIVTSPTGDLRAWLARAPAGAFGAPMTFTKNP